MIKLYVLRACPLVVLKVSMIKLQTWPKRHIKFATALVDPARKRK
jgi:hypothetical protein